MVDMGPEPSISDLYSELLPNWSLGQRLSPRFQSSHELSTMLLKGTFQLGELLIFEMTFGLCFPMWLIHGITFHFSVIRAHVFILTTFQLADGYT